MPRKLVWTEGLFVTQHHLQQLDAYHESLVSSRMRAAVTNDWGVVELEIDERALAQNQLKVNRFEVVLPDGTPLKGGDNTGDAVQPRSFDTVFTAQTTSLDVWLAIPARTDGRAMVELLPREQIHTRYARAQTNVSDFNSGAGEHPIDYARPNVKVLFADEAREGQDAIRIAQLVRAPTGAAILRDTYVAPCFEIRSSPYLMRGFRAVLTAMTSRQRALVQVRRQRVAGAVEFDAQDTAKFWFLSILNGEIPQFSHVVDRGSVTPEAAYLVLASLIGELCTFSPDVDPSSVPKFNYLDLGASFEPMFAMALSLLNATLAERYVEIPLARREDGVYIGQASAPEIMQSDFFLAVSGTIPEAQVRDRLPKLIKIASSYHIVPILHSAVNGARVELEYRPPGALPAKPGMTIFRVQRTPEFWPDIAATGSFAIYHPFDARAVNLNLYAVAPNKA